MIQDCIPWKRELKRIANFFNKESFTDKNYFLIEKNFFVSAYIVRKLIESKTKIPTSLMGKKIAVKKFNCKEKKM